MIGKLRVGIILPGETVPAWVVKILENLRVLSEAELALTVMASGDIPSSNWVQAHFRLDRRLYTPKYDALKPQKVSHLLAGIPTLAGVDEDQAARLQALKLDVLLNLSLHHYPEFLLDCARCGVWTLHDGETRFTAGSPVGWREMLDGQITTTCALEVSRRGATPLLLARATIATDPQSFSRNQMRLFWKASTLVPQAIQHLALRGEVNYLAEAEPAGAIKSPVVPPASKASLLLLKHLQAKLAKKIRQWFLLDQWTVLIRKGVDESALSWEGYRRLVPPGDRYWADPFLIEREGSLYVFFEEFPYDTRHGRIHCITMDDEGQVVSNQAVLEQPYHLSYPFVFMHRGEWYMLPESAANRTLEVYRCTRFPDQWQLHKTLMRGVSAYDATLIEHAGLWWMFVTMAGEGNSSWDTLHLFHADDPLSNQWIPHPRNPVISDVGTARMAGRLFRREGNLFRPSQDSSRRYGYALNLNRVVTLTPGDYAEVRVDRLEPPRRTDILAVHTLNSSAHWTVLDANIRRLRRG
jgi:hypothetical protein